MLISLILAAQGGQTQLAVTVDLDFTGSVRVVQCLMTGWFRGFKVVRKGE
jgi:hypothetical protein